MISNFTPTLDEFGPGILNKDGGIDRKALAAIVFRQPERLAKLNAIVHPAVEHLRLKQTEAIGDVEPEAIVLVEAAIHIETGGYKKYPKLVLVVCSEPMQLQRAMARDQATREEVMARLSRQMPISEKRKFADYVIDTSGTVEETHRQTVAVYNSLRGLRTELL